MEESLLQALLPEKGSPRGTDRRSGKGEDVMGRCLEQGGPRETEAKSDEKGQNAYSYFFRKIPSFLYLD